MLDKNRKEKYAIDYFVFSVYSMIEKTENDDSYLNTTNSDYRMGFADALKTVLSEIIFYSEKIKEKNKIK